MGVASIALLCALNSQACRTDDARQIAEAVDRATDDDRLRAVLSVYAWHESGMRVDPAPVSWDARAGIASGPWQLWRVPPGVSLAAQARHWLQLVQRAGLPSVDSDAKRAVRRLQEAAAVLTAAR